MSKKANVPFIAATPKIICCKNTVYPLLPADHGSSSSFGEKDGKKAKAGESDVQHHAVRVPSPIQPFFFRSPSGWKGSLVLFLCARQKNQSQRP
jgi:hypothetical protein